jgi:hypothetical protein
MEYYILAGIAVLVVVAAVFLVEHARGNTVHPDQKQDLKYQFVKKQFIMSAAENDLYRVLQEVVGSNFVIVPQAHLSVFLDHRVKGQSWQGALSTIQRKSVDFLICSHTYYNPLVAIELDDSSHQREDRVERDTKVDQICETAGMPLIHIRWQQNYAANDLLVKLTPYLK